MADAITSEEPVLPQGVTVRAFDDPKAARAGIYSGTLEALQKRFPLENKTYRLELSNVRYTGPQDFTLAQQKHALLNDKPLHTPVSGHFRLIRKADNAVVDEKDEVVMNVPYYTDRGTIINNGSEYTVANQLRLRPGVYTRVRRSGDVETQFNVKPGTGRGFRLRMEPATGVITVNVGHANMPLYPLLKALGVSDQQMIKAWGADVAHANAVKASSVSGRSAVDKLYSAFAGYNATAQDLVSKERYLAETLPKFALDPGVTARTLGISAEGITPEVLLRASSKMFNVNRGEEKPDDRDNPGFANVFGIEDLYRERIEKDAGKLSRNIMMKISRAGSLKPVGRGAFSGWHHELLQGSGLAMPGDNSNPMALEEQMMRVTRMGEGGIGSADVVTDEARQVNPGNLNFIDVLAGPENEKIGVDARLSVHARKGSDGKLYSLFLNRQGRKEYVACDTASDSVIGFPNPDPKEERIPAMKNGRVQMVPRDEVDYFVPSMSGLFSSNVNLNPMPTSVQGGRQFYGAKFWGQYMPTVKGEVPLVDSLMPDGKMTWGEHYGRQLGTLRSPAAGTVTKVTDKGVTVTDKEGKKHFVETVTDFPFNGLTGLTYTPTVKVGDKVAADDMLAASNFVDKKTGGLAMGVNLRMAWLPYKGYSVSGDTNVLWRRPDGSFTFGPIADVHVGQGMGSIAVDPKTGEQHIIDATAWMIHRPDAKMYCVRTSNGATVKVTGTHGMMKYDGHHGLVECRADELVPGKDVVAFVRPAIPFGTGPSSVECSPRHGKDRTCTYALTRDFGWLVGIYLSEGCVVYRDGVPHNINIACTEQGVIDNIRRICADLCITCVYRKSEYDRAGSGKRVVSGRCSLHAAGLTHWVAETMGRYAWGKYIPDITWTAPRDFALGLLDGYICGDGCITDKQSTISTSSPRMADGLCLLLNAIGVRANNRQYRYDRHALQRHAIHMVYMFRETVGNLPDITLARKDKAVKALRRLYRDGTRMKIGDVIPVPCGSPFAFGTGHPTVSRDKARALMARYTAKGARYVPPARFLEDADALLQMPLMWARVQAVDEIPSEPYVYDLDMRPYGTFVVGYGMVVHNSYEDAICISESAAKKLATDRLYGFEADPRDGGTLGLNKYMSAFPKKFTKEQYATLDDNGVVKEGTVLNKGDPIAVAVGPKMLTAEDANLGKLSKVLRNAFTDKAQVWDHDYPGTVVSSTVFRGRAKVNVKASPPLGVADKLSPRFALKGVVGCYDPATEVLTSSGWKAWPEVTLSDRLAVLPDGVAGCATFARPEALHVYDYDGYLVHAYTEQLDYRVTGNHRMYCRIEHYRGTKAVYRIRTADDVFGKRVVHLCAAEFAYNDVASTPFDVTRYVDYDTVHERKKARVVFDGDDFAEFLGWYISEGNTASYSGNGVGVSGSDVRSYKIQISQSRAVKPRNCARIEELLGRMGLRWLYHGNQYTFSSKPLYRLLHSLGRANEKYLPDFVWGFSKSQLRRLFTGLMLGDGTVTRCATARDIPSYVTTSPRLARQVEFLMTLLGYNVRIRVDKRAGACYSRHGGTRSFNYNFDKYTVVGKAYTELGQSSATFTREQYTGKVYCATVPGGLLYVRRSGRPMWCGNSIIPDDKMPRDAVTNEPYDILMNPMGIPSRVAPGQLIETALGKLAKATGKPIHIPQDPPPEGWAQWASNQLAAAGVSPTADVFDPETGRTLHGIGDGYVYFHAMHHLADKKISAKGGFGGYTADLQPAKGGKTGAKRISGLDTYALIAHGATEVMKDVQTIRGTKNEEFWKAVRSGGPLPMPQVPFVYQKAMNLLRAGGINVVEGQKATDILPMTDADTDKLAGDRIIRNSKMLDDELKELKGGLFDPYLTGGNGNRNRWAAIALPEAVPNPVMEEPVRRLLGLTGKKLQAIIAGEEQLNGLTGGAALQKALAAVDVDAEIRRQRDIVRKSRGSVRDNAVKVIGYLSGCKKQGITPKDWMITKIPVIPTMFRPIAKVGDTALVSDINELYRDVIESSDAFSQLKGDVPDSGLTEERLNVYKAVKAAYGLGEAISPEGQAKRLKGAIRQVIGTSPKFGLFQSKVISKAVDSVGRAVISPEPNYDMDQCGIPENEAWTLYKDYVMRGLRRRGYSEERAAELIEKREPVAKDLLLEEMGRRPVILDRAPTWHKFNLMAFWPSLVPGNTLRMNPVVEKAFTADHDGDTMNFHVPASDKAVSEAVEKMLPSKNLFSTTDLRSPRYVPMMEMTLGLAKLTAPASRVKPNVFVTSRDAIRAYRRGEIGANDPVSVLRP